MDYEIVQLAEKHVAGYAARTSNASSEMGAVIGGLWGRFYQPGAYEAIPGKRNEKSVGIYTDYAGDETGDYTAFVGCEAAADGLPGGMVGLTIPAGKYAKFVLRGRMEEVVADFWTKLWDMELPRAFLCDFEEYQNSDMEHAEIHVYIGLRDQ